MAPKTKPAAKEATNASAPAKSASTVKSQSASGNKSSAVTSKKHAVNKKAPSRPAGMKNASKKARAADKQTRDAESAVNPTAVSKHAQHVAGADIVDAFADAADDLMEATLSTDSHLAPTSDLLHDNSINDDNNISESSESSEDDGDDDSDSDDESLGGSDDEHLPIGSTPLSVSLSGKKSFLKAFGAPSNGSTAVVDKQQQRSKPADVASASPLKFKNKQRVMLLGSRGMTFRYRHLLTDLEALLPHSRKDSKFDSKGKLDILNELADLNNCNNTLYFDVKKKQDLYWWISKTPHGPSAKFLVQNVHTMDELKLTGNCLKGSRPLLSFDDSFDTGAPHMQLLKQLLIHTFGTPKHHRKSKPFFDHVFTFSLLDNRIWFRNYQIVPPDSAAAASAKSSTTTPSLVEIGPRFVLNPIRVFEGSFGGPTMYENPHYVKPNAARAVLAQSASDKYAKRQAAEKELQLKMAGAKRPRTAMDDVDDIFRK